MAKPICIIFIDPESIHGVDNMWKFYNEMADHYAQRMPDYHIFVLPNTDKENPVPPFSLNVFYEKDFTDIEYAELKAIVEGHLQNAIIKQ